MELLAGAALLKLPRCTLEPLLERFIQFRFGTVVAGAGSVRSSKTSYHQQQENAVTYRNGQGETLLIQATKKGDEACVVMLLLYTCLVQQTCTSSSSSINDLHTTWTYDSRTILRALLCARDKRGMEAVHYAADLGHTGILKCLIQLGGAHIIYSCTEYGARTALHMAAAAGHTDCVRFLLQAAGSSSGPSSKNASSNNNKTNMICINDLFGQTALHLAAESGHTAVLSLLLDQQEEIQDDDDDEDDDQSVNFTTNSGAPSSRSLFHVRGIRSYWTPLHSAVFSGRVDCVQRLLLQKDADVDCLGDEGQTPLHMAAGRPQQIKRSCFSNDAKEDDPSSPKKSSTTMEDPLVELLFTEGARVNAKDWHGETPLFKSAFAGNVASARVLLQYGANPQMENGQGETALDIAVQYGQEAMVSLLQSALPQH
jgi:ankyrin repeat protein